MRVRGLEDMATAILRNTSDKPLSVEVKLASSNEDFAGRLLGYGKEILSIYKDGMDLSQEVARIAKRDNLDQAQTKLVITAVNRAVYDKLFGQTQGRDNRKVTFKIADPAAVLALTGMSEQSSEVGGPASEGDAEEKQASDNRTALEKLAALEIQEVEPTGTFAAISDFYKDYVFEKVAKDLMSDINKSETMTRDLLDDVDFLGACFAKYASVGVDVSAVFEKLARDSKMEPPLQVLICSRFDLFRGKDEISKQASIRPLFQSDLKDFSLGKFSIGKIAEDAVVTLPEVVDKKRAARNFQQLVNMAIKIQEDDKLLQQINERIDAKKAIIAAPVGGNA